MAYKLKLPASSRVHPIFHVSCLKKVIGDKIPVQTIFLNLTRKEKSYWNLKNSKKQELDSYEIDQFQSISLSGRTYLLKIPHGRMRILCRSIQNCSSVEDNTFLKERGMLGPYNTSDYPITIVVIPLIYIVVPLLPPYCYLCAP